MDIHTPRGQQTLADEQTAIGIFERHYPLLRYIQTPKERPAVIDGIIIQGKFIYSVVETKCRYNISYNSFVDTWDSKWLVTFDKIEGGRRLADAHCVPLHGFLFLVKSELLLTKKLYTPGEGWLTSFGVTKTETQATCNGGAALRDNAFIDMAGALQLRKAPAE